MATIIQLIGRPRHGGLGLQLTSLILGIHACCGDWHLSKQGVRWPVSGDHGLAKSIYFIYHFMVGKGSPNVYIYALLIFFCSPGPVIFYFLIKCEPQRGKNEFRNVRRPRKHCYCVAGFNRCDDVKFVLSAEKKEPLGPEKCFPESRFLRWEVIWSFLTREFIACCV